MHMQAHRGVEPLPEVQLHNGEQAHQGVEPLPQVHLHHGEGSLAHGLPEKAPDGVPGTAGSWGLRGTGD